MTEAERPARATAQEPRPPAPSEIERHLAEAAAVPGPTMTITKAAYVFLLKQLRAMEARLTPPAAPLDRDELVKIVGTALYGWGPTEPNEATGFTARYESEQVADAILARLQPR